MSATMDAMCIICGIIVNRTNLSRHMLRNHNESEFSCETCPKSFKTKLNLKLHLRTHDTPKNFKCDKCDKVVQTRTALWKHVKTKHDNLKYKCSYCSSTFTSKSHCQVLLRQGIRNFAKFD